MSSPNNLEIQGSLHEHPLAELLVEAATARLSGSFRLGSHAQKAMIYLRGGEIVFAVSNARRHRLFEMLLQSGNPAAQITGSRICQRPAMSEACWAGIAFDSRRQGVHAADGEIVNRPVWQEGEWTSARWSESRIDEL